MCIRGQFHWRIRQLQAHKQVTWDQFITAICSSASRTGRYNPGFAVYRQKCKLCIREQFQASQSCYMRLSPSQQFEVQRVGRGAERAIGKGEIYTAKGTNCELLMWWTDSSVNQCDYQRNGRTYIKCIFHDKQSCIQSRLVRFKLIHCSWLGYRQSQNTTQNNTTNSDKWFQFCDSSL